MSKKLKSNLGKLASRGFFGRNEECLLVCVVCLQRLISNDFLLLKNWGTYSRHN